MAALEPRLRKTLQLALEQIERGLKDASEGRDIVKLLLSNGHEESDVKGVIPDTYFEMAMDSESETLRRDPTAGILEMADQDENHSVFFIRGCCGPKTPIVHPDNNRLLVWIILGMVFILYEVFLTPYRLCFNAPAEGPSFYLETVIAVYFIADVFLNFFVSFYNAEGQVIRNHGLIMRSYVKGWFLIDCVASVPVDWIEMYMNRNAPAGEEGGPSPGKMLRLLRALRFLRMARVLRIAKLQALMDRFEQEIEGSSVKMLSFTVFKILLVLNGIAHVAGCFWFLVATTFESRYGVSWLTEKMPEYAIDDGFSRNTLYIWSYHFAMVTMTTVGYGDVSPTNTAELVYTVILLWVSLVVFSACMGVLMNLISRNYEEGQERRNRLMELAKYMNWRVLPRPMRGGMRKYLNFVWDCTEKIGDMEGQVMEWLSPSLRSKLCVHIFGNVLYRCPFLTWMTEDREAMKKLCLRVRSTFFEAGDMLFSYGERNGTVFILVSGWVTMCIGALFTDDHDPDDTTKDAGTVARRADNVQLDQKQLALARANKDRFDQLTKVQEKVRKSFTDPVAMKTAAHTRDDAKREYAYITAPAFFGESVLFSSEPAPVQYSAKCMTRAEFTILTKEDIEIVVNDLPYLQHNYDIFVESIKARWRAGHDDATAKVTPIDDRPSPPTKHPANNDLQRPGSSGTAFSLVEVNGDEDYWEGPKKPRPKRRSQGAAKRKAGPASPETPTTPKADLTLPNAVAADEDVPQEEERARTPQSRSRPSAPARKHNSGSPSPSRSGSAAKNL
jgi:CRP-like cAMP-binding protein